MLLYEDEVFMPIFSPLWGHSPKKAVFFCLRVPPGLMQSYKITGKLASCRFTTFLIVWQTSIVVNSERYFHIITIVIVSPWWRGKRCAPKKTKVVLRGLFTWRCVLALWHRATNAHLIFSWHNRKKTRSATVAEEIFNFSVLCMKSILPAWWIKINDL